MTQRIIPPVILPHLRELALEELGELLAQLDANLVDLVDFSNVGGENGQGKPDGTRTYTIVVRRAKPAP